MDIPLWGQIARFCEVPSFNGDHRPLAMAKADHSDAYKQLPRLDKNQPTAVITLKRPTQNAWSGAMLKTRILRSTAAVLHCKCLSRVLAALVHRFLKISCVGGYDDYGTVLPGRLIYAALDALAGFNDCRRRKQSRIFGPDGNIFQRRWTRDSRS